MSSYLRDTTLENITVNDFFTWKDKIDGNTIIKSSDELFIWCELTRDAGESLNYDELYKCYGFYIFSEIKSWEGKKPVKVPARTSFQKHIAYYLMKMKTIGKRNI